MPEWHPPLAARSLSADAQKVVNASRSPSPRSNRLLLALANPKNYRLSYFHRLHQRWEYQKFFDQSEVFRLSECVIFRIKNDLGHFRLGITLKARGTSPERNAVKRSVREAMRRLAPELGSFDYNVVIPGTKKMAYPYPDRLRLALGREFKSALVARVRS